MTLSSGIYDGDIHVGILRSGWDCQEPRQFTDKSQIKQEAQGHFTSSDIKNLPHFGSLCSCQVNITQTIKNYNLPAQLEHMYTSGDSQSKLFRANSQIFNNAMLMCSLTAEPG